MLRKHRKILIRRCLDLIQIQQKLVCRMEEKALQLEAEAEASGEVYKKEKSLDDEFASLKQKFCC